MEPKTIATIVAVVTTVPLVIAVAVFFARSTVVAWEGQATLHFRHGQLVAELAPGLHRFWGRGHSFIGIETRPQQLSLGLQEIPAADGLTVKITAVATYQITDAARYHRASQDADTALYTAVQITLRHAVSARTLDEVTASRGELDAELTAAVGPVAETLGFTVISVAVRDLVLPAEVRRLHTDLHRARVAGAAELEEARTRAAVLRTLANTAKTIEANPAVLKLRTLETVEKVAAHGTHTFVLDLDPQQS